MPHTLFKQWEGYITSETTLSYYGVKTKAYLDKAKWTKDKMLEKDVILISNTLYGKFQAIMTKERINWKRVFYDEADTLHIPSTQLLPGTKFTWFISATYKDILRCGGTSTHYMRSFFSRIDWISLDTFI